MFKEKKKKGLISQMSELSWFNLPTSWRKISQIATPLKSGSQIWSGLLLVKELTIHSFLALQISITILAQLLGTTNQHHNPCTASWHNNSALQSVHSFLLGTANQHYNPCIPWTHQVIWPKTCPTMCLQCTSPKLIHTSKLLLPQWSRYNMEFSELMISIQCHLGWQALGSWCMIETR